MNNSNSISKSDLAQLDNKFDIDIAGLNSLLDKVLDKTPGYAPQKNYANISSNQTPNQSNQAGGSQQSTPQTQTLKSRDNGQNNAFQNGGNQYQAGYDQSNISYTQFVQGTKADDSNEQFQYSTPKQGQGFNDYSGFLKPNQNGDPVDYTSFLKSPGNESNSKLNVNEEDYNADDRDRIQVLVRESIRPSEAKLIDFGEVKNGAEILEQLENKENRDTTQRDDGTTRKVTKRRRRKSVTPIIDETLEQVEKDMNYMNKCTTDQILKALDGSEEGQLYLIDAIRRAHKPTRKNKKVPEGEEIKKVDPIDEILVNPADTENPDKLITIYQQVSEVYEDGTKYEGEKFMGKRHGKGTYYYQEGYKYEGSWEEDQMCGFGCLWINEDTKWYEGDWHDNMFHGRGILYNLNPEELVGEQFYGENFNNVGNGWSRYEGQFYKGVKQGFGCLFLTNGDQHVGNFNEDNVHGRGSYTRPGQFVIAGLWENGEIKIAF